VSIKEKLLVKEFEPEYISGLAELYKLLGSKLSSKLIQTWMKSRKYSKVLVALLGDKVIGKVTLDMAYKPYSEIVNLMVHPDYRGQGVGSRLVEECISLAESNGFTIQFLMADVSNVIAHKLYAKYGFIVGILLEKLASEKHVWLYRFSDNTFVNEFVRNHPLVEYSVSRSRVNLKGKMLYLMKWTDPITEDSLRVYLQGQAGQPLTGGTMPRITAVQVCKNSQEFTIITCEKHKTVEEASMELTISILNKSSEKLCIEDIDQLIPSGIELIHGSLSCPFSVEPNEDVSIELKYKVSRKFDIPALSFTTVVLSYYIYVRQLFSSPIVVLAGFDRILSND